MEETEMRDDRTVQELQGPEGGEGKGCGKGPSDRRALLLAALLILGLFCVLQAVLNISLRLSSHPEAEEAELCHLNASLIEGTGETPADSAQPGDACSRRLRALQCRYQALETDRDRLQEQVSGLSQAMAFLQREQLLLQQNEGSSSLD